MEPTRLDRTRWLEEWSEIWADLTDAFAHSKPSPRAFELYADRLADIPADRLRAAAEQCLATCRHLPTIAELRERAGQVAADISPVALDVYGETVAELSRALAEARIPRLDPVAAEVVRGMGGPRTLCGSDNGPADRARFVEAYNEKLAQRRAIESVVPMARRYAPAPPERQLRPVAMPALPAPDERPLSTEEAIERIRQIRAVRHERAAATRPAPMPDAPPVGDGGPTGTKTVDCTACALPYATSYVECPRCAYRRREAERQEAENA